MRKSLQPPAMEGRILIDIRGVCHLASLSITTVRRLIDEKLFPPGIKCGGARNTSRRWVKSDIIAFLESDIPHAATVEVTLGR